MIREFLRGVGAELLRFVASSLHRAAEKLDPPYERVELEPMQVKRTPAAESMVAGPEPRPEPLARAPLEGSIAARRPVRTLK